MQNAESPLSLRPFGAAAALLLCLASPLAQAANTNATEGDEALLERGKYLVEQVAMCADCHSPHDQEGRAIAGRHLTGAATNFTLNHPPSVWATYAPGIAGLKKFSTEQAIEFLSTGEGRPAGPTRPPMPAYRFSTEDSVAVVAYLKSLKPAAH